LLANLDDLFVYVHKEIIWGGSREVNLAL
jgi:hypothetical protein